MIDLVSEAVGGHVVTCNDEFFAPASNLLKLEAPVWKEHEYTDRGKWMDGWETRRRREPGHDWCIVALGVPGRIEQVVVDTSHFTGNYPEQFSMEVCGVGSDDRAEEADWTEIIGRCDLTGDTQAVFELDSPHRVTHLRLNIFPDGGVARLRVHGRAIPQMRDICPTSEPVDLASLTVGGEVVESSDSYFSPPNNMLRPTDPQGMWDGWETRRRRDEGHDWAVFRLGLAGLVESLVVDTRYFKGNAPGWVSAHVSDDGDVWTRVVERAPVEKDAVNAIELSAPMRAGFVKMDIHPDGGVARFRVLGRSGAAEAGEKRVEYVNALLPQMAESFFRTACAATRWVRGMISSRPFGSVDEILSRATGVFADLGEPDWLEAFAAHPRIGDKAADRLARSEQSGAQGVDGQILSELAVVNADYEARFGFTCIIYATGKSATEMLEIARSRLGNSRDDEVANAAAEQQRITATRLRRMLCQEGLE